MTRSSKAAPASAASQDLQTGDAGSADAVSVSYYTTSAPPGIPPRCRPVCCA